MTYFIHFYEECPATGMDIEIEITFACEEEEDQEIFWGFPVSVPASNHIEILEVVRNGKTWNDYPDNITDEIHKHEWESVSHFTDVMARDPKIKYHLTPNNQKSKAKTISSLVHEQLALVGKSATNEQIKRAYNRNRKNSVSGGNRFYIATGIVSYLTINKII